MSDYQFKKFCFILIGGFVLGCIKFNYAFWFLAVIFLMAGSNCIFTMEDWGVAVTILVFIPILAMQGARDFLKGDKD